MKKKIILAAAILVLFILCLVFWIVEKILITKISMNYLYDSYQIYCLPDSFYSDSLTEQEKDEMYENIHAVYARYMDDTSDYYYSKCDYAENFLQKKFNNEWYSTPYHDFEMNMEVLQVKVYPFSSSCIIGWKVNLYDETSESITGETSVGSNQMQFRLKKGHWVLVADDLIGIDAKEYETFEQCFVRK